jgi:hypothetical protein
MPRLDGIRRQATQQRKPASVGYPDLSDIISEYAEPIVQTAPVQVAQQQHVEEQRPVQVLSARPARIKAPRMRKSKKASRALAVIDRPRLKTLRVPLWKSGMSWFLTFAVLSTSVVGILSIAEHGRAAKVAVEEQANQATEHLGQGANALSQQQFEQALQGFQAAQADFESIQKTVNDLSGILRSAIAILPNDILGATDTLTSAGVHVAVAGQLLTSTFSQFTDLDVAALQPPDLRQDTTDQKPARSITEALESAQSSFPQVVSELDQALALVSSVDVTSLPGSIAEQVGPLTTRVDGLRHDLAQLQGLFGVLANIAGADRARTYAIVFQNPNELRPTGGFMGQFALLKIDDGRVERLDIKSIYDADGQVATRRAAPDGLNVVSQTFSLRDANWFPAFPDSAQALLTFFQETGDPRIDGVIALNPEVVTQLLAVTGPVTIDDLNIRVTEDNFVTEAQYEVPDKDEKRDSTFFPSFASGLLSNLFSAEQPRWAALVSVVANAVLHKDIQTYFSGPEEQQLAQTLGVAGVMPPTDVDGLAVVEANIGGGKTDQYIQEERSLTVSLGRESVRHELSITRTDTRTDQFKDKDNRSYIRVFVPSGSTLVSADGFDRDQKDLIAYNCSDCVSDPLVDRATDRGWEPNSNTSIVREGDWQVFANWLTLQPGQSKTINLVYETPLTRISSDAKTLKFYLWRQPGSASVPIDLTITGDQHSIDYASEPMQAGVVGTRLLLDQDRVVGIIYR